METDNLNFSLKIHWIRKRGCHQEWIPLLDQLISCSYIVGWQYSMLYSNMFHIVPHKYRQKNRMCTVATCKVERSRQQHVIQVRDWFHPDICVCKVYVKICTMLFMLWWCHVMVYSQKHGLMQSILNFLFLV